MRQKEFYIANISLWDVNSREKVRNAYLDLLLDGWCQKKDVRILDVGCGCGQDEVILSEKLRRKGVYNWRGLAIDQNEEALSLAQKRIGKNKFLLGKWELRNCDLFDASALAGEFSLVVCSMVVMHYENLYLFIDRLQQLLDENGRLLLVTNNPELIRKDYSIDVKRKKKYLHIFQTEHNGVIEVEKFYHSEAEYYAVFKQCGLAIQKMMGISDYSSNMRFFNKVLEKEDVVIPNFLAFVLNRIERRQ